MSISGIYHIRKDLFLCFFLVLLYVFVFKDIVIQGHLLFGDDFINIGLNYKHFLYHELHRHHSIPYWNPYIFGGIPFWAHFESTIFYPLDFLFLIISPEKAYGPTMFIHLALAGLGFGLVTTSLSTAVIDAVGETQRGVASGLVVILRLVGMSTGLSLLTAWGLKRFEQLSSRYAITELGGVLLNLTAQVLDETFLAAGGVLLLAVLVAFTLRGKLQRPSG